MLLCYISFQAHPLNSLFSEFLAPVTSLKSSPGTEAARSMSQYDAGSAKSLLTGHREEQLKAIDNQPAANALNYPYQL